MIEFNFHNSSGTKEPIQIKIAGIGGAGTNVLDRLVLDGIENVELIALNTDVQSLTSSVAAEKIQLGHQTTRGLGAGGDPEVGFNACEEAAGDIAKAFEGAGMVFLCVGLGGGTGSGAAPVIAQIAREAGALVIVFATVPFLFEGKRRRQQAEEALQSLQEHADAVICFENEKMADHVAPKAGIHQAFATADQTVSQSIRAICNLFNRPGLIRIGFDELTTVLRNQSARCLFGYGEAEGDNRANDCLARALKNPLMDRGRMLSEAQSVLVNVAGSPNMTLNEVNILMTELNRHVSDHTHILFGTAIDPKMGNRMSVTLVSSIGEAEPQWVRPSRTVSQAKPAVEPKEKIEVPAKKPVQKEEPLQPAAIVSAPEPKPEAKPEPIAHPPIAAEEAILPPEPSTAPLFGEPIDPLTAEPQIEAAHFEVEPEEAEAIVDEQSKKLSVEELGFLDPVEEEALPSVPISSSLVSPKSQPEPAAAPEPEPAEPEPAPSPIVTRVRPRPNAPLVSKVGELNLDIPTTPKGAQPDPKKSPEIKQETLQFEPVTRGRFEKSEPTIVDGQDLDVPTFLRRNVRIK